MLEWLKTILGHTTRTQIKKFQQIGKAFGQGRL